MAHPVPAESPHPGPSALARAVFLAGLALWVRKSLDLLPYWYRGLHYVSSLEWGYWGTSEWVHPVFVPLLAAYRFLLSLLGYSGGMLIPLELLNLAAGALTLGLLFRAAERVGGNSWTAAAGTLMLAFSRGFWSSTLRPDPYALGAAASLLTLLLLQESARPAQTRRFIVAGLAAGLTTGLHASGLSLAPLAVWAALKEPDRRRSLLGFAASMALAVVLGYAVFLVYNGIGPEYFGRISFPEVFSNIEQETGTSLYTSRDPLKQVLDYHGSLHFLGAAPFLALGVALGAWAWIKNRGARSRFPSAASMALMNFAVYSLFFLINNTHNKFIYVAWLPLPILLSAAAAGGGRAAGFVLAGVAGTFAAFGASRGLGQGPDDDPIYAETRYWDSLLRDGDFLILPGCPAPEVLYGRRPNLLPITELSEAGQACLAPPTPLAVLPGRIREALGRGAKIYFPGEEGPPWKGRAQEWGGIFETAGNSPAERVGVIRAARQTLMTDSHFDCDLNSPQGRTYCRLSPKPGRRAAKAPPSAAVRSLGPEELRALAAAFPPRGEEFIAGFRARYLRDWLALSPEDAYAKRDLLLLAEARVAEQARALQSAGPAAMDRSRINGESAPALSPPCLAALDRADAAAKAQRRREASAALRSVAALCPEHPGVLEHSALLYRSIGDFRSALAHLEKQLRRDSKNPEFRLRRAEILADLGRRREALEAFGEAEALGLAPDGQRRAAWGYQGLGAEPDSLRIWKALVQKPGARAKDFSDKAVCEFKLGAWENAVSDLRRSLELAPADPQAYASLGAIYSSRGMDQAALEIFDRGLSQDLRASPELGRQLAEARKLALARLNREPGPGRRP